ncbi:MAG: hypothetical protein IRY89_11865 [Pseudolabrys sp.]|nr:hypothetical protein [Pseudolabrys sp.]
MLVAAVAVGQGRAYVADTRFGEQVRMVAGEAVIPLMLFTGSLLACALHGLAASGQFPREHRDPSFASPVGRAVLFGTIAVMIASLVAVLTVVWRLLPWYAAVIGGGLAILAAPPILQQCPDRFVDGRASLLSFAGAGAVFALLLLWLGANRVDPY